MIGRRKRLLTIMALPLVCGLGMLASRWIVFVPNEATLYISNARYYMSALLVLVVSWKFRPRSGMVVTLRQYIALCLVFMIFSWGLGEALFGFVKLSTFLSFEEDASLSLTVVENDESSSNLTPDFYGRHSREIYVILNEDPFKVIRTVEYTHAQIPLDDLAPGDSAQVVASVGWAGYRLKRLASIKRVQNRKL